MVPCLSTLQIDLIPMINKSGCECLNESDDHPFTQALSSTGGFLESDTDEQVRMGVMCWMPGMEE